MQSQLILIAGPSGSGKSTLANALCEHLSEQGSTCTVISLDNYYRDLSNLSEEARQAYNFDQPEAWEFEQIIADARALLGGQIVNVPVYDFSTHLRTPETRLVEPQEVIVMEGLFALCSETLNQLSNQRIFVELDDATALARRISRDTKERGRSEESVIVQYKTNVILANQNYVFPSAKAASIKTSGNIDFSLQIQQIWPS